MQTIKKFFLKTQLKVLSYFVSSSDFEFDSSDIIDDKVFLPFYNENLQRDLVWAQNEKEALIESIMNGLTIPPIIAVNRQALKGESENYKTSKKVIYIIDGKQRVNAVRGYINNEYKVAGCYFGELANLQPCDLDGEMTGRQLQRKIECALRCVYYHVPMMAYDENYKSIFVDRATETFIFTKDLQDDMITLFVKHNHTGVAQDKKALQEWADIQQNF